MVVIFGKDLYGSVDKVPGQFYVATEFIHIFFIPILPNDSYLIRTGSGGDGFMISLSWKSVLTSWARCILGIWGTICLFRLWGNIRSDQPLLECIVSALWFAGTAGPFIFSYTPPFTRASPACADFLAHLLRGSSTSARASDRHRQAEPQGFAVIPLVAPSVPEREFRLHGARDDTGETTTFLVWATDEAAARARGEEFGIRVERVDVADTSSRGVG